MLDSTRTILAFAHGRKRSELDTDRLLLSGIIRELQILGEAAGKVSQKTQDQFPQLPWRHLVGMRNRLIHAYFDVDNEIIWTTIKNDLPSFCKLLESVIAKLDS